MSEKKQSGISEKELENLHKKASEVKIRPHGDCKGGLPLPGSLTYFPSDTALADDQKWRSSALIHQCGDCNEESVWMKRDEEWKSPEEYCELLGIKHEEKEKEDPADTGELIGWEGKE